MLLVPQSAADPKAAKPDPPLDDVKQRRIMLSDHGDGRHRRYTGRNRRMKPRGQKLITSTAPISDGLR